ncbi:enoyl-CoA hydratase-related protein [Nocardia sp. NPDC050717]|uniref:enoyl-CoA hydratase-related protein n=1 Tax=Nocardia sp. NPDC050717 TaxID=3157221 RepID=UPI0033CB8BCC
MKMYETILVDEARPGVGLITLRRPERLNALNRTVEREVLAAALAFDRDRAIGAVVITGSERAFAAGADIAEMSPWAFGELDGAPLYEDWDRLAAVRTPLIAAVSGYALGGGCELAMLCDFILASETAEFGQPEITLGILPGIGGTQRLTRAVGKAKAMELCLTGRRMGVEEAERAGLIARIVPAASLIEDALSTAELIAKMSRPAAIATKDAVNRAFESSLAEGIRYERALFTARFATADQKEGMAAFLEKREAKFVRQ